MRTVRGKARFEEDIKRSRFIAHATRVDSLADTLAFYESVADPSASHNCWAWKLDHQYRFNDDGEPASTAGKPILSAIEGKNLDHVMVVVTRHFGGIKLGVGGLVRAYSGAAARSLDRAEIIEVKPTIQCAVTADFSWTGQVYAAVEACGGLKISEEFTDGGLCLELEILESELNRLSALLRDTTRGQANVRKASCS